MSDAKICDKCAKVVPAENVTSVYLWIGAPLSFAVRNPFAINNEGYVRASAAVTSTDHERTKYELCEECAKILKFYLDRDS